MTTATLEPRTSEFAEPAPDDIVERTAEALRSRGYQVRIANDRDAARDLALGLIPIGSEVHQASSRTIDELGISAALVEREEFVALKPRLWAMDRTTEAKRFRQVGAAPDVIVGSVHALTEDGVMVTASGTGSQLGAYAYGAGQVVLVIGSQKIVPDLATALRRIEEHTFPLEDARAQLAYGYGARINKLYIQRGDVPDRTSVVLVREAIGF